MGRSGRMAATAALLAAALGCGSVVAEPDGDGGEADDAEAADRVDGPGDEGSDGPEGDGAAPVCGDGTVDPGEACDDGELNSDTEPDACRSDCREASCGDGVVDTGEACDDGNDVDTDACRNSCRPPGCGNGVEDPGEECDDGNAVDTDACLPTCVAASCGDEVVWAEEEACDGTTRSCVTDCGSAGRQECDDACSWRDACEPPEETCNGSDDDCDTEADEDFGCVRGASLSCRTICDTEGTAICPDDCEVPGRDACVPPPEACGGGDDDCDGETDEGFECVRGTSVDCRVGACAGRRTCSATCVLGSCDLGAAPANDLCPGAISIDGSDGTRSVTGSTCAARSDYGFGCEMAGMSTAGADVVYRFTLSGTRAVTATVDSSDFPAALVLQSACGGAATLACEPGTHVRTGLAQIERILTAGTYYLVVDAWLPEHSGAFTLTLQIRAATVPANDTCTNSVPLLRPGIPLGSVDGTTLGATNDSSGCGGATGSAPDVWYRVQLDVESILYLSTLDRYGWDSHLSIRSGSCTGAVVAGGCADDACGGRRSQYVGRLPAGTYYVAVDGWTAASYGSFTLFHQASNCLDVEDPVSGPPLDPLIPTGAGTVVTGSTMGRTHRFTPPCETAGSGNAPDLMYVVPGCPGAGMTFSTCDTYTSFDTTLTAYYGTCGGLAGPPRGCANNDTACLASTFHSTLPLTAPAQGLWFVSVDGDLGGMGQFRLRATSP